MRHAVLREGQLHTAHEIEGGEKQESLAGFGAGQAQGDREMGFADARRALKDHVAAFAHEAPGGQLLDQGAIDGGLEGEVKIAERLRQGRPEKFRQMSMTRWGRAASSGSRSRPRKCD